MFDKANITFIGHLNIFDPDTGATLVRRRDLPQRPVAETVAPESRSVPDLQIGGQDDARSI
jgi:hypothetical protein